MGHFGGIEESYKKSLLIYPFSSRLLIGTVVGAVTHNILLMRHEAATALPVAYLDSAQTAYADPCDIAS